MLLQAQNRRIVPGLVKGQRVHEHWPNAHHRSCVPSVALLSMMQWWCPLCKALELVVVLIVKLTQ